MKEQLDVATLLSGAKDHGYISSEVYQLLNKPAFLESFQQADPISPLYSKWHLVSVQTDQSQTAVHNKNIAECYNAVTRGCQRLWTRGIQLHAGDVLFRTQRVDGSLIQNWTLLKDVAPLEEPLLTPQAQRLLYDSIAKLLGHVVLKAEQAALRGIQNHSFSLIIATGKDEGSVFFTAEDIKKLVTDMLHWHNHFIAFVGIDDGETDFRSLALEIGIPEEWILKTNPRFIESTVYYDFGEFCWRLSRTADF